MLEHHASHVILELCRRGALALKSNDKRTAENAFLLARLLEGAFPEAVEELQRQYPQGLETKV